MRIIWENEMASKMVITIDIDSGKIDSVTDEDGKPAQSSADMPDRLKNSTLTDASSATVIGSHSSPGCRWVFYDGNWYWICT